MNRRTLESLLLKAIKHHRITYPTRTEGRSTSRITQQALAELLAQYIDTHLPTGKRRKCGKEIRGHRRKWCSDRCQERLTANK